MTYPSSLNSKISFAFLQISLIFPSRFRSVICIMATRGRLPQDQWLVFVVLSVILLFYSNNNNNNRSVIVVVVCFQHTSSVLVPVVRTQQTSFILPSKNVTLSSSLSSRRLSYWQTPFRSSSANNRDTTKVVSRNLRFNYDYDILTIGGSQQNDHRTSSMRGILLVHPIGVGIAKWFYQRLLTELQYQAAAQQQKPQQQYLVVVPDLLGCGSACNAILLQSPEDGSSGNQTATKMRHPPLLNITDWSAQLAHVMATAQQQMPAIQITDWCVVANGGCAPIALHVAAQSARQQQIPCTVSQVILSSTPRLSFFLERSNDPTQVAKAYRTLCGITGQFFWWYACRYRRGRFIQKFSERNLVADPASLGDNWTINCINTATAKDGKSRYATFGFLAGTLQDGCAASLQTLLLDASNNSTNVTIDVIKGRDTRRNQAKSWFWKKQQRRRRRSNKNKEKSFSKPQQQTQTQAHLETLLTRETFCDYVAKHGNGGREIKVGGRISLAHEDAAGYAAAILELMS